MEADKGVGREWRLVCFEVHSAAHKGGRGWGRKGTCVCRRVGGCCPSVEQTEVRKLKRTGQIIDGWK